MKLRSGLTVTIARIVVLAGAAMLSGTARVNADIGYVATLDERIRGAEAVVVATVRHVAPEWRENRNGDRLIVSRIELAVVETLKGGAAQTMWMEMEGGTLDGLTLQVSSLPLIRQPGDRAVFFLDPVARGVHAPHRLGQGILFIDSNDVVRGSSLSVGEIRNRARSLASGR